MTPASSWSESCTRGRSTANLTAAADAISAPASIRMTRSTDWGWLVHPDEIRAVFLIGQEELDTVNGSQLGDTQLKGLIDHYVGVVSSELTHNIYPQVYRHNSPRPTEVRRKAEGELFDDPYPFRTGIDERSSFSVILRHRPLIRVLKWQLQEPVMDREVVDLLEDADVNYGAAILRNQHYGLRGFYAAGAYPIRGARSYFGGGYGRGRSIANAHLVDYVAGYHHANDVPRELKEVILRICLVAIMSAVGQGRAGGALANYSLSLSSIHESVGTTMSATSDMAGARILEFVNYLKDWSQKNLHRYRTPGITIL